MRICERVSYVNQLSSAAVLGNERCGLWLALEKSISIIKRETVRHNGASMEQELGRRIYALK